MNTVQQRRDIIFLRKTWQNLSQKDDFFFFFGLKVHSLEEKEES